MNSSVKTVFISLATAVAITATMPAYSGQQSVGITNQSSSGNQAVAISRAKVATPEQYFNQMVKAVKTINYKGILVFNSVAPGDGSISALKIIGKNSEQKEVKISSIDGKPVSIYRKNNKVKELLGGRHQLEKIINNPFENFCARTLNQEQLAKNYQLNFKKDSVTAGRDVKVVMLAPKNQQVYGYSFYIDKETYMPLKMDYIPSNGTSINSYMFVDIDYPKHLADQDMVIKGQGKIVIPEDAEEQQALKERSTIAKPQENPKPIAQAMESVKAKPTGQSKIKWQVGYLPSGFVLIDHQIQKNHEKQNNVEHFVFSDGIALISVYIEKVPENQIFRGSSIKGAMSAFGTVKDGHQVVVVGKIPIATLEQVGKSVHISDPSKLVKPQMGKSQK